MSCSAAYSGNVSSASALRGALYVVVIIGGAFDSIGFPSHYGASTALFLDVSYRVSPVLPHILTGRELGQLIDILEGEVRQNSLADVGLNVYIHTEDLAAESLLLVYPMMAKKL